MAGNDTTGINTDAIPEEIGTAPMDAEAITEGRATAEMDSEGSRVKKKGLEEEKRETLVKRLISQHGGKELLQSRVFIVGQGRVGKTSLYNAMVGECFQPSQASTVGVQEQVFQVSRAHVEAGGVQQQCAQWQRYDHSGRPGQYVDALAWMEAAERRTGGNRNRYGGAKQ